MMKIQTNTYLITLPIYGIIMKDCIRKISEYFKLYSSRLLRSVINDSEIFSTEKM